MGFLESFALRIVKRGNREAVNWSDLDLNRASPLPEGEGRLEGVIRPHLGSRTALRIRRFLSDNPRLPPFVIETMLRAHAWSKSIRAGEAELLSRNLAESLPECALIEHIAENLVGHATGTERQLLLKSIQEALFFCLTFDTALNSTQVLTRLKQFLDRRRQAAFIQRFLSLYVFNGIWFHSEEWFCDQGDTSNIFEKDIEEFDRLCKRAVAGAFKHVDVLSESAAEELIRNIERRLTLFCRAAPGRKKSAVHRFTGGVQMAHRLQYSRGN